MSFIFQQRASQYTININQTSASKVMVVRICVGIPYQLSSAMIYYKAQSDIRVKTFARHNFLESSLLNSECLNRFLALCGDLKERLWPFIFAMGFIFQQRASQYIININRISASNVMVVRICVGIPYQLSGAMIYHGAQSDIRVKTFARRNLLECSLLNSECFDRLLNLFGDSGGMLWSLEFMMDFIFQLRACQYIMSFKTTSESKVMIVRICMDIPCQLLTA